MSNLEILNANLINDKITQQDRFVKLSEEAKKQFKSFSKLKMPLRRNAPLFEKPQKEKMEQDNPTAEKFIKNIQADNVELKDTDFEKNIERVALSKTHLNKHKH